MREKIARIYPHAIMLLLLFWAIWSLIPLQGIDPHGGLRVLGLVLIDLQFFWLGLLGLYLWHRRMMMYEFALSVFIMPFVHLAGFTAPSPFDILIYLIYFLIVSFMYLILLKRR